MLLISFIDSFLLFFATGLDDIY